jgi:hypothetical protein
MRNFIDDSGSFNWHNQGVSLFCGVTIAERDFAAVSERFAKWRRSIVGSKSTRELKGADLTPKQLDSFTYKVLPATDRDVWLTVVGADTRVTSQEFAARVSEQASAMFLRASELMEEAGNKRLKESYRQLSGWAKNRSPQNVLWIIVLEETVIQTIHHCIARFLDPQDATEFEDLRISIDESFIRRDEHIAFWREWLRNGLQSRSKKEGMPIPIEWRSYDHPFIRAYRTYPGLLNLHKLFVRDTGFFRSVNSFGLQIADICANICYRHHRGEEGISAYHKIRPRIVGRDGREVTLVHVDGRSLHQDDPRNHVELQDMTAWKNLADKRRSRST